MTDKVSIIVPVYNADKYISRCIDSILKQTHHNLELIIINDGSKDMSEKIITEYVDRDDRIIYYSQLNSGVAKARNKGLEYATGDYVMFVDADDYINEEMIEVMVTNIEKKDTDIICVGYNTVDDEHSDTTQLENKTFNSIKEIVAEFRTNKMTNTMFTIWGKLYKKNIVNKVKFTDIKFGEDTLFFMTCCGLCKKIAFVDYVGYNYFDNSDSSTNTHTYETPVYKDNVLMSMYYLVNKYKELGMPDDVVELVRYDYEERLLDHIYYSKRIINSKANYIENRDVLLKHYGMLKRLGKIKNTNSFRLYKYFPKLFWRML